MKKTLVSTKNFVRRHQTAITITAITIAVIQHHGIKQMGEFLKEHDLYDAYFTPDMHL